MLADRSALRSGGRVLLRFQRSSEPLVQPLQSNLQRIWVLWGVN